MKYCSVLVFSVLVLIVVAFDGVFAQQQTTPVYMTWPIEIEPGEYTYEYDFSVWGWDQSESVRSQYLVSTFKEAGVAVDDTTVSAMRNETFADTHHDSSLNGKQLITMRIVRLTRRATTNEILIAMDEFGLYPGLVLDLAMIAKLDKKRYLNYVVALGNSIRHPEDPFVAKAPCVVYIDEKEEREARLYFPDRDLWERAARFIAIVR